MFPSRFVPVTPLPVIEENSWAGKNFNDRSSAAAVTASARGCSLPRSRLAASCSTSASVWLGRAVIERTFGLPSVNVPVLSTTSVSTFSRVSRAWASLISTPAVAPLPSQP